MTSRADWWTALVGIAVILAGILAAVIVETVDVHNMVRDTDHLIDIRPTPTTPTSPEIEV